MRYTVAAEFGAGVNGSRRAGVWSLGLSLGGKAAGQFDWFSSSA